MKKTILIIFLLSCSLVCFAQIDSTFKIPKPKLVFGFDGRFSFVKYDAVTISGLKIGLDFDNRVRVGLGIYGLLKPAEYSSYAKLTINKIDTPVLYNSKTKLWYGAAYIEYVITHKKRWEVSTPIQFGIGKAQIDASYIGNPSNEIKKLINEGDLVKTVYLIEPSVTGYYKIFNWFGLGAGLGYRQLINGTERLNITFNNPIFIVKGKIFLGDLTEIFLGRKPAFRYVE